MENKQSTIDERVFQDLVSIIDEWKEESHYRFPILIGRYYNSGLTLCTTYPGRLIGFRGELVRKYLDKIRMISKYETIQYINWVETMNLIA